MDGNRTERYVTYDRWDAEHSRLNDAIKGLRERIRGLEDEANERRSRQWNLMLAFLASLVFPLILTAIVAFIAARGH